MPVAGSYAHRVIEMVPIDALTIDQETKMTAAICCLVLHSCRLG